MTRSHVSRLDLNLLKVFAAVYRERHITRAGRTLFISQSAVSHAIAKLRALLGDPLFVRAPDGMQPTALADRLAPPILQALQGLGEALQANQRFDPGKAELEFTVGTTTSQPFQFLPRFYARFEREAPRARLMIRSLPSQWPNVLNALDAGTLDVLVTVVQDGHDRALEAQRFRSEHLFDDPLVCVVSRHNARVGARLDVETYARLPHLIMASDRVTRTWIDDALEQRGLARRIAVVAPHAFAIPTLLGSSHLVSTVARSLATPFVDHPDLRLLEPPIGGTPYAFKMIWSSRTESDPALGWLRNTIRESCLAAPGVAAPAERPRRTDRDGGDKPARGASRQARARRPRRGAQPSSRRR